MAKCKALTGLAVKGLINLVYVIVFGRNGSGFGVLG